MSRETCGLDTGKQPLRSHGLLPFTSSAGKSDRNSACSSLPPTLKYITLVVMMAPHGRGCPSISVPRIKSNNRSQKLESEETLPVFFQKILFPPAMQCTCRALIRGHMCSGHYFPRFSHYSASEREDSLGFPTVLYTDAKYMGQIRPLIRRGCVKLSA